MLLSLKGGEKPATECGNGILIGRNGRHGASASCLHLTVAPLYPPERVVLEKWGEVMEQFDQIIVGAGSAGCVLAGLLSADSRRRVLVLEAGGTNQRFWVRTPIGYGKLYYDAVSNWMLHADPDPGLDGREAYWPRGKGLGGSSAINAMVYCRGLPDDYADWQAAGNPSWGWETVRQSFEALERRVVGENLVQGEGALWVSYREGEYHPLRHFFYAAAEELGLPITRDMNGKNPEGVGPYALTTRRGLRCSAADAFLHPALGRSNLAVRTDCLVERIVFEGQRAVGVVYRQGNHTQEVRAGEVILAAGAVHSPGLLQRSGVGPGALLQSLGIETRYDNSAVGGGLQDHLGVNYSFRAHQPTLNQILGSWRGRLLAGMQYLLRGNGPLSLSVNQMGGMVRSDPQAPRADVQLYCNPLSYSTTYINRRPLLKPDPYPGFIIGFNPCRPTSRGRIDLRSPDCNVAPSIQPNSLSTTEDQRQVVAAARLVGRLRATQAMQSLIERDTTIDLLAASDEALLADFRARCGTVFHPCGTCKMAPEAEGGVVDEQLRVYGTEGLRVVDASVFPNVTSANTNAPTLMLAHRAAGLIMAGSA